MAKLNFFIYILALTAAVSGLAFGMEIGSINQVLQFDSFRIFFGMSTDERTSQGTLVNTPNSADIEGWIVSLFLLGCIPGAALISFLATWIGRKFSIMVGSFFFTLGSVLQGTAINYGMMLAGRFIGGLGIGLLSGVAPLYIAECAPTSIRGRLTGVQQLMITIGICVANVINAILGSTIDQSSDVIWRWALGILAIPGGFLFVSMWFLPFSPRWLLDKGRDEEAYKALERIYGVPRSDPMVDDEFTEVKDGIELEKQVGKANWLEIFKKGIINRVLIAMTLQIFQQWTGINAVMYYSSALFIGMGYTKTQAAQINTTVNSVVNVLATLPGLYLIERVGRRPLLIFGGIGMCISMAFLCGWVHGFEGTLVNGQPDPSSAAGKAYGILAAIALYMFVIFFASCWGGTVWVYQSEIFPMRVRSKGVSLATLSNWVMNFVIAKVWPYAIANLGANQYIIFAATGFAMTVFSYLFVPETRGRSLEEMDLLFGSVPGEGSTVPERRSTLDLGGKGSGYETSSSYGTSYPPPPQMQGQPQTAQTFSEQGSPYGQGYPSPGQIQA